MPSHKRHIIGQHHHQMLLQSPPTNCFFFFSQLKSLNQFNPLRTINSGGGAAAAAAAAAALVVVDLVAPACKVPLAPGRWTRLNTANAIIMAALVLYIDTMLYNI